MAEYNINIDTVFHQVKQTIICEEIIRHKVVSLINSNYNVSLKYLITFNLEIQKF